MCIHLMEINILYSHTVVNANLKLIYVHIRQTQHVVDKVYRVNAFLQLDFEPVFLVQRLLLVRVPVLDCLQNA